VTPRRLPTNPVAPDSGARSGQPVRERSRAVDAARGAAIAQMVAYHFCYDLNYFSYIHIAMLDDPAWITWRTTIVAQFLFLAGISVALRPPSADRGLLASARFWVRWMQIAGCAALVSAASWWLFGPRFIWFGVLHFVALAQIVAALLLRLGGGNILLGVLALVLGTQLHLALFAADAMSWIGFAPAKPQTEDFVPLFPWLGVLLLGMGASVLWHRRRGSAAHPGSNNAGPALNVLATLGQWPLTIYMLHQPLLFAIFSTLAALRR